MPFNRKQRWIVGAILTVVAVAIISVAIALLPALGAGGLLHPARHHVVQRAPEGCDETSFDGAGVRLTAWRCHAPGRRRGTVVYLHGVADNRSSSVTVIRRFSSRGFDVVAYDSRAHGDSGGDICTYGYFEKEDLHLVVNALEPGRIVLIGTSLGAAVALQEAAQDARVDAVVAAETFSDLRTVATERAPLFFTSGIIGRAFQIAEQQGHFQVDSVSPATAATWITVPVLIIHGDADSATRPDHSRRVFAALKGPKRLIMVPGAPHDRSLRPEVWDEIERWVDAALGL